MATFLRKSDFFCKKFWRFGFLLYLCTTKTEQCSVRLAGPGRKILILEIMGSNPIPSTTKVFDSDRLNRRSFFCLAILHEPARMQYCQTKKRPHPLGGVVENLSLYSSPTSGSPTAVGGAVIPYFYLATNVVWALPFCRPLRPFGAPLLTQERSCRGAKL